MWELKSLLKNSRAPDSMHVNYRSIRCWYRLTAWNWVGPEPANASPFSQETEDIKERYGSNKNFPGNFKNHCWKKSPGLCPSASCPVGDGNRCYPGYRKSIMWVVFFCFLNQKTPSTAGHGRTGGIHSNWKWGPQMRDTDPAWPAPRDRLSGRGLIVSLF